VITGVLLAAGASTRMGVNKLLLRLEGEPIVRRAARRLCDAGLDEVLVVLGRDAEAVREALDGLPCRFAINTGYQTGLGSSFRVAVEHLGPADAAVFALADQPFVTTDQYRRIGDAYRERHAAIVSVRYGEVTAPPHLFARELFPELTRLQHGAKPVLMRHQDRAVVLDFPAHQLVDIDTPEDYANAQQVAAREA
jgi:molybdenum cofactor cytidylyltransferase